MASIADLLRAGLSGLYGSVGGWPVDTGVSLANLGRAAYGYGGSKLGLLAPQELPDMIDPANVPGSTASISGLLGVGDSGPEQAAQIIGGLLAPGGTKNAASKLDMTVYHGSPHTFDKFDMSHLGSGEGAQAYGHGLYFADNPAVAKGYAETLSDAAQLTPEGMAARAIKAAGGDLTKARRALYDQYNNADNKAYQAAAWNAVQALPRAKAPNLYKVDIPDDSVANMLHWDKPMSQQPQSVRAALGADDAQAGLAATNPDMTGQQLYNELALAMGDRGKVSQFLNQQGIPGIRYLDGGSRGAGTGSYNTVLFDDALARILERQ